MLDCCEHCGGQLAVGAVACFRCGRLVTRAEEGPTGASVVVAQTNIGTVARAELLEGQWRLVKVIGQGAVAQVWQGHDVTLDRAVAVKVMHEAVAADPEQVARFEREARVLAGLEHPNLLPVLGIGRLGSRPFLVTRLLEGKTLAELMHQRGGKLSVAEAARVLVPVCEALSCLHQANVVHRDLKPSNVFVGNDQRVTLMDLGSAHEAGSELTRAGEGLSSVAYLSPELRHGEPGLTGKSDVYALGCLLLEVLTGKPPDPLAPRPAVSGPLGDLALSAMALAVADRPTALEIKARLSPFLAKEEVTAPMKAEPAGILRPPPSAPRRPPEAQTGAAPISPTPELPTPAVVGIPPSERERPTPIPAPRPSRPDLGARSLTPITKLARPAPLRDFLGVLVLGAACVLIVLVFGLTLARPPAQIPEPTRVDNPAVAAPIKKEYSIAKNLEPPKFAVVFVPNLDKRKQVINTTTRGFQMRVVKKSDWPGVAPGVFRLTTSANGKLVPCQLWIKHGREYELLGRTPVDFKAGRGDLDLRLQHDEDPLIHVPFRAPPVRGWFRVYGGIRVEIGIPPDDDEAPKSRGEPLASTEEPQPPIEEPPLEPKVAPAR